MYESASDLCTSCVEQQGLCTYHAKDILPQLARPSTWLRLMGMVLVEQKARQLPKPEKIAVERVKRRNARKLERAQRQVAKTHARRAPLYLALGIAA